MNGELLTVHMEYVRRAKTSFCAVTAAHTRLLQREHHPLAALLGGVAATQVAWQRGLAPRSVHGVVVGRCADGVRHRREGVATVNAQVVQLQHAGIFDSVLKQ